MSQILDKIQTGAGQLASKVDPAMLATVLGTAGISGLAGGYLTAKGPLRKTEDPAGRRRRILRNALLSAAAGGGAAALGGAAAQSFGSALPADDVDPVTYAVTGLPGRLGAAGLAHSGVAFYNRGSQERALRAIGNRLQRAGMDEARGTSEWVRDHFNTPRQGLESAGNADAYAQLHRAMGGEGVRDKTEALLMNAGLKPTATRGGIGTLMAALKSKIQHGGPLSTEGQAVADQLQKRIRHSLIGERSDLLGGKHLPLSNKSRLGWMGAAFMYPELLSAVYHASHPTQIFKS